MALKVLLALVGLGVFAWVARWLRRPRSYAFRLGRQGFWIDGEYYRWQQLLAVTHYPDLDTVLIKVSRPGQVPLALKVDLGDTRFSGRNVQRLQKEFARHVADLPWKSV